MGNGLKLWTLKSLKFFIVLIPMLVVMYLLYALGKHEIWTPETAHRDKITIAVVFAGMVSSFLIYSYFLKRAARSNL